jgi:hypothetical protein
MENHQRILMQKRKREDKQLKSFWNADAGNFINLDKVYELILKENTIKNIFLEQQNQEKLVDPKKILKSTIKIYKGRFKKNLILQYEK